ncbi:glycosyltransferase family 2 protein [Myxococcota bacterium]|nr:glycosyltransferase family 2 protein [Myxococcota bacterium]
MDLSVIIPAYNEATGITSVLERLKPVLGQLTVTWELIVVNDGSTDRTGEILRDIDWIRLIEHPVNLGYGASLKTGIRSSEAPWVAILDADGTYPEQMLPELVRQSADADMVVASRTGASVHIPLIRRPAKRFITRFAGYIAGRKIPDLNSGMRVMRRSVVEKFFHLLPDGFSFTTTITLAMLVDGYRVKYHPIDYHKRSGKSKIRPIYDTMNFLSLITRTGLYFRPLKVFFPVSLVLFLLGLLVLFGSWHVFGRIMDSSATILIMTSVQFLALGLLAELVVRRSGR